MKAPQTAVINEQSLRDYWHRQQVTVTVFPREQLARLGLGARAQDFLSATGLPTDASPYLSFAESVDRLEPVGTGYGIGQHFNRFIKIGFDGAGNPLVVNTREQDVIQWLDHEDGFTAHYVNRSLPVLVACLVCYDQFIANLQATRGPDAYLDADFTDEQLADLKAAIAALDAQAVKGPGLWQDEFTTLLANRAHYQQGG